MEAKNKIANDTFHNASLAHRTYIEMKKLSLVSKGGNTTKIAFYRTYSALHPFLDTAKIIQYD